MPSKPKTFQRLTVHKHTSDFRAAVSVETVDMCHPGKEEICIKVKYAGVNATDVNITKGRYFNTGTLPYPIGFEGVGEIVELGEGITSLKIGQSVAFLMATKMGAYGEYICISYKEVYPIPEAKPEYLTLLVSGLTSTIGLDKAARIMAGETVLVTAAAGGAGHLAVQWAKAADCHVIGTCSTPEKEKLLKELGCDRVINYKKESISEVLSKEYPRGVDVVWETIGGQVFQDCINNMAVRGRLIIIGMITQYKSEEKELKQADLSHLPAQLLFKSVSLTGFLVLHYQECFETYFKFMTESLEKGKLKPLVDSGKESTGEEFFGMEGIIKAVEHLHSGKSFGKVVARVS